MSGTSLALVKSYLTNRYQYVQFERCKSDLLEIKTGIHPGYILGPVFFSILINDIVNSRMKFSFLMYADDITIYFNLENFQAINQRRPKHGNIAHKNYFSQNSIYFRYQYKFKKIFFLSGQLVKKIEFCNIYVAVGFHGSKLPS